MPRNTKILGYCNSIYYITKKYFQFLWLKVKKKKPSIFNINFEINNLKASIIIPLSMKSQLIKYSQNHVLNA